MLTSVFLTTDVNTPMLNPLFVVVGISKIPLTGFFFLLPLNNNVFNAFLCSFCWFILVFSFSLRGEVHCGCFGRGDSVTEVCQQVVVVVVVGVAVSGGTSCIFYLFFVYKSYGLINP